MGNRNNIVKRFLGVVFFCFSTVMVFGEGSKDLYPKTGSTGFRASLLSTPTTGPNAVISSNSAVGIRFPNPGRQFVYAKFGEVIHVGSSAQGVVGDGFSSQTGTINLVAPNGTTYTSGTSTTVGKINFQSEEEVGPSLTIGDGGYTSYSRTVGLGEEGIWVIDFVAPNQTAIPGSDANSDLNATSLAVANGFTSTIHQQTKSRYIVAWDVTVVTAGVRQTGRVYQTVFSADLGLGANSLCDKAKFYVVSKDGYQYLVEPKAGFRPFQFAFFANNKGVRYNTGANAGLSAYRSAKNTDVENAFSDPSKPYDYHVPSDADDGTNITYKLFYNTPDNVNLPDTASIANSIYGSSSTWLFPSAPVIPTLTDLALVGKEGTPGKFSTTAPLTGGFITFNSNQAGAYRILIDANNDGDYTDNVDLTLRGDAVAGANSIAWDGKDGLGNLLTNTTTIKVNAVTLAGEVHFPLADAEKNLNGIQITRLNGTGSPNYTVYWDDQFLNFTGDVGASSPLTNLDNGSGQSSITNGHKWGTSGGGSGAGIFGDQAVIDTWTNVFSADQNLNVTITSQVADLEIVSLVGNLTNICVGTEVTYTFIARNNGPNNSGDVTVSFVVPTELTNLSVVSASVTSGTATGVGGTFSGTTFTDVLNMDNGAVVTYVVKGTIGSYPSGGNLNTSARILRAADVTDPDATNDDTSPPTDPTTECNGAPSGVGCNNIKNLTTTVNALPSTAALVSAATLTNCNNSNFTVQAVVPTTGSGTWSVISGTATIANLTNTTTNVSGVTAGETVVLRWTVSNGTCTPSTVDITLVNNALPSTAALVSAATLTNCNNSNFTVQAVVPTTGSGTWSVISGTATIANLTNTTTNVSGVTAGQTVVLRWTVSNGTCTPSTVDITLVNNALPSTAALVSAATLTNCNNSNFTVQAVVPTTGSGTWSVISGTATIANLTNTTTNVSGVTAGQTVVLRWTVSNGTCTPSTVDITLVNNAAPSTAALVSAATLTNCNNSNFTVQAVVPTTGSGTWSVISGTATIANLTSTTTNVSGVTAGETVVLRWTVSNGTCTPSTVDITLVNNASPSTAALVSAATLTNCNNSNFTVQAVVPTTGSGAWSVISGTATIANLTNTTTNVSGVTAGQTVVLRWTVSNGTCTPSTVDITLVNNLGPSSATLTTAASLTNCNNDVFNIGAVTPTTGTGVWTVVSGTATIANANATSTSVSNVTAGNTAVLRWTVSSPGCTSNTVDVTLINNALPSTAGLISPATLTNCNNSNFTVQAAVPTTGSGTWSVISGTASIANLTSTTTNVSGVTAGETVVLRWTVSNGTCTPSTVDITLVNNASPSTAALVSAATLTNCNNSNFAVQAVVPTTGSGTWSVISGTATIANLTSTTTNVSGVTAGETVVLRWTVSNGTCTPSTVDITLVNNASPSTAALVSAATLTNCNNSSFTVQAVVPTTGSGTWSVISGTATIANLTNTTTNVSGVTAGQTVVLRWTVTNGTCTPSTVDITLVNNLGPSSATLTTAASLTNCNNDVFNIGAVTPTVGTGVWTVVSGTATIANANATSTSVTNVTAGNTAVLRWTVTSPGCTSNTVDVTLINNALPSTAALVSAATLTNCNNSNFTVQAAVPTTGSGTWSVISGTATIANLTNTTTNISGVTAGQTVVLRWTVSNGTCTPSTVDITLVNNLGPSSATLTTAASLTNCNNDVFNIGAVTPTAGTGVWTVVSGTATITNANATSTSVSNVTAGNTAVLRWTVSSPGCTSNTVDVTLINNASPSTAALISPATLTNCNNSNFTVQAAVPTTGSGTWSVISGTATIANLTNTTTNVSSVTAGETVVLRWAVSNGTCTPSTVDITLVNNAAPSTAALVSAATLTNCNNSNFTVQAAVPTTGSGTWSVISGTATIANLTNTTTNVSGVASGETVVLRWTVSNGTCTPSIVDITLVNNALPSTAALISPATLTNCNNSNFTVQAAVPTTGSGTWSVISGTATIANLTNTTTNVSGVTAGETVVLRWTVSNGTCTPSTVDITLVNNATPSTAALISPATITNCNNGNFAVQAVVPTTGSGTWSVISGTATIANLTSTTTNVSGVKAGETVVLRWTVSNGTCTPSTVDITLVNNALPSTAALISPATLTNCNNSNFTVQAVVPTTGSGAWSVISGTVTIANLTNTTTNVSGVASGETVVLRWTVSNGTCTPSTVDITLVNNASPSTAALVSAATLTNCNNSNFTVQAAVPTTGSGTWSVISGTATIANLTNTTTNVSGVTAGQIVVLRWTVSNGTCTPSTVDITLINNAAPSVANAGTNQVNCNNGSFTMAALTPTVGTGSWSIISGLATIISSNLTNTLITSIPVGTSTTLRWSVNNGLCPASVADIILTNAESVNAGSNIIINCVTTAKLSPALSGQVWTTSISNPSAASINSNGEIIGLIKKGIYQFTLANANCSATITVTKNNCPPVALNDTQTVRNDQILTGTLKPKVSDPDSDVLTLSLIVSPTRGTIVFNTDGTYTYTPTTDYVGTDSITYRVCDTDGLCAEAKLYINVTGTPKPPVAINDSLITTKNTPVNGNVLTNDYNFGTNTNTGLTVTTTPVLPPANGTVLLNADGTFTYTPAHNFTGLDSFKYVICNAIALCDTATVYISINEPPSLQPKLEIEKRIDPSKIQYGTGETVTYTVVAKSTGNTAVHNISVLDILPVATKITNVKINNGSPTAGTASYESITNIIFWSIPLLGVGDSAILKYTLVLADSGVLKNVATISSPMIPGISDTASLSILVVNQADIKISKFLRAPAVISVNDEIGFTMIAENFGPAIGTEVVVQDSLYANLSDPRSMTVNIGKVSYDPVTRKITWRIDTLLVGQKDSLVIRVKVLSGGQIKNGATVRAKQSDPVSGNNGSVVSNITGGQVLVEGKEFFIPSVFTPNGDGKNDKFVILGLNRFPGSELIIYNRWGNVVYQSKDYKNDWTGNGLNEATYYYTLNLKTTSGIQKMAGWVQILR